MSDQLLWEMQEPQYFFEAFLSADCLLLKTAADQVDKLAVLLGFSFELIGSDYVPGEGGLVIGLIILLVSKFV